MAETRSAVRKSGMVAGDEIATEEGKQLDTPVDMAKPGDRGLPLNLNGGPAVRPEDRHMSLTPSFARMRTDWNGPDREVIQEMHKGADLVVENAFPDVFAIFYQIYRLVRVQKVDTTTGEMLTDVHGLPIWQTDPDTGEYVEDWSRMRESEREEFLYKLTIGSFRWGQKAAKMKGEALYARAAFEEAFSHGYEELEGSGYTIDDRTARARVRAADHRYFAVYLSYLLERASALMRSVELLNQRLKDLSAR